MRVGDLVNGRFGFGIVGEVDHHSYSDLKIRVIWFDGQGMTWCNPDNLEVL